MPGRRLASNGLEGLENMRAFARQHGKPEGFRYPGGHYAAFAAACKSWCTIG